jgi:hypothetical protein
MTSVIVTAMKASNIRSTSYLNSFRRRMKVTGVYIMQFSSFITAYIKTWIPVSVYKSPTAPRILLVRSAADTILRMSVRWYNFKVQSIALRLFVVPLRISLVTHKNKRGRRRLARQGWCNSRGGKLSRSAIFSPLPPSGPFAEAYSYSTTDITRLPK